MIPQLLKRAPVPYATGCFGKWNIGFAPGSRPTERGFDEFIGHASGNIDYYRHNYRQMHDLYEGTGKLDGKGLYSTDLFGDAAIDFMRRKSKASQPWFCYLAFNAPHFPVAGNKRPGQANAWQAPDWAFEACGSSPEDPDPATRYGAVVYALDHTIGRVLEALEETGTANRTFVFFMSDNGAFRLGRQGLDVGVNTPLRQGGVTCWEGGLRVAAMARWPGRIEAGAVVSEPLWSPDLLTACARIAGAALPGEVRLDGRDPLPVLTRGARSPHESFYFEYRSHAAPAPRGLEDRARAAGTALAAFRSGRRPARIQRPGGAVPRPSRRARGRNPALEEFLLTPVQGSPGTSSGNLMDEAGEPGASACGLPSPAGSPARLVRSQERPYNQEQCMRPPAGGMHSLPRPGC